MGIRKYNKDHLKERASKPVQAVREVDSTTEPFPDDDPLRFWTLHSEKPVLVDLHFLSDGETKRARKGGTWSGPFTGRPALIGQLAPVVRALLEVVAPKTVTHYLHSFRGWWRLFDSVEAAGITGLAPVETVADVTELHRQRAFDIGMSRTPFAIFIRALNLARASRKLPQLYWDSPEEPDRRRHLPPKWQIDEIRFAIKHGWYEALDRWAKAEELLNGQAHQRADDAMLLNNYKMFVSVVNHLNPKWPSADEFRSGMSPKDFSERGYTITDMLRGFYPDATDIRMAFHLCVASTGWNPAVLLDLDVDNPFVEPHPKDPARYVMRANKARGNSEQLTEGLFKSQSSTGVVLLTLMKRTEPLRVLLRNKLVDAEEKYEELASLAGTTRSALDLARKTVVRLKRGLKSPWLYITSTHDSVVWLDQSNYHRGLIGNREDNFLDDLIACINQRQPANRQVSHLTPSDFRDAFAAFAYHISGGMVLYVMKVLGQKRPRTTQDYLDNTVLNDESNKLFRTFSQALWREIKVYGRVDPSIIAKWCRDGGVSDDERGRLHDYRSLRRSRIGVGCKDPTHPPKHIAPDFEADGKSECHIHRCTLCIEGAVIFPDSVSGLCMRLAELQFVKANISSVAFLESSFPEEKNNTELALAVFDPALVQKLSAQWAHRISTGEHRVIDLEGAAGPMS